MVTGLSVNSNAAEVIKEEGRRKGSVKRQH
jgi:hypothetical protein